MEANLVLLPSHPDYCYQKIEKRDQTFTEISLQTEDNVQLTRGKLREYMLVHSVKGNKFMPKRSPFVGDTKTFASPIDSETKFVIRRLSVIQVMTYRDRNSVVRYVTEEESGKYTTERDYPAGTMNVDLATLGLASWNIQDTAGNDIKINEDTIKTYLDPEELDFVAEKVLDINPILTSRGNQKREAEEDSRSPDGSNPGGNEPDTVHTVLPTSGNGTGGVPGSTVSTSVPPTVDGVSTTSQSIQWSHSIS